MRRIKGLGTGNLGDGAIANVLVGIETVNTVENLDGCRYNECERMEGKVSSRTSFMYEEYNEPENQEKDHHRTKRQPVGSNRSSKQVIE